jgi:methylthioribose-1-phosphate isomerase
MSLSLISSPFAVNATTNNLPFVVTSPSASSPQFKLVTDIYIPQRSPARLTRIKTAPSASLCMVDIAKVASDYLTYDTPMTIITWYWFVYKCFTI